METEAMGRSAMQETHNQTHITPNKTCRQLAWTPTFWSYNSGASRAQELNWTWELLNHQGGAEAHKTLWGPIIKKVVLYMERVICMRMPKLVPTLESGLHPTKGKG